MLRFPQHRKIHQMHNIRNCIVSPDLTFKSTPVASFFQEPRDHLTPAERELSARCDDAQLRSRHREWIP